MGFLDIIKKVAGPEESPSENIPPFKAKVERDIKDTNFEAYKVFCRGTINPSSINLDLTLSISLMDKVDNYPLWSRYDEFKESTSHSFHQTMPLSKKSVPSYSYYPGWTHLGGFATEILIHPKRGRREIEVRTRIIKSNEVDLIYFGSRGEATNIAYSCSLLQLEFNEPGYTEVTEFKDVTNCNIIKLAVYVALSDGSFAKEEGNLIKEWIQEKLMDYEEGPKREKAKTLFNKSFKEAYEEAKRNPSYNEVISNINEKGTKALKYDAMELCMKIMAADGIADKKELAVLKDIATSLSLSFEKVQLMKKKAILDLNPDSSISSVLEEILDIDPGWEKDKIKQHLLKQFKFWNGLKPTLPPGEKSKKAQNMLDLIAAANRKYE